MMQAAPRKGFKELEVWRYAMQLADMIYEMTQQFPAEQRFCLVSQMQRAAVSVASNIAEGSARASKKEFVQFLYIARGSIAELETQCLIARGRNYLTVMQLEQLQKQYDSINRMLGKLIASQKPTSSHADQQPMTQNP